ncbi:MAG: hypothetical protein JWM91_2958 [Rhodospirillales bacterium]|nr:hypothetical protein [Rhodospirillales bacterium]
MGAADIGNGKIKQRGDYYDNLRIRAQMGLAKGHQFGTASRSPR